MMQLQFTQCVPKSFMLKSRNMQGSHSPHSSSRGGGSFSIFRIVILFFLTGNIVAPVSLAEGHLDC